MASKSGKASATSCQRVSTTDNNLVRACWTSVGSGSERRARRPEAVARGRRGRRFVVVGGVVERGIASAAVAMMIYLVIQILLLLLRLL
mmetsp:Transcript_11763/g.16875  ORF Transcript_11763/g.16875 Transcript_11763/m.16875 type:complete len:89 (-) Transcript_11763:47-313(-)